MEEIKKIPSLEELLRKIQELEKNQDHLKQQICQLVISGNRSKPDHQRVNSAYRANGVPHGGVVEPLTVKLNETRSLNVLQSMDQAIHVYDFKHQIIFWNQGAERIYGYTPCEAIGRTPSELLAEPKDAPLADFVLDRTLKGESWSGEFPVKSKSGEIFVVICTNTPYYDENSRLLGAMCISSDSRPYQVMKVGVTVNAPTRIASESQQSLQTSIASKISNLASKVKSKMKTRENCADHEVITFDQSDYKFQSEEGTPRGHVSPSPFGVFFSLDKEEHLSRKIAIDSGEENENKPGIRKILSSKAEEWMGKKGISWPWKGNETENDYVKSKLSHFGWRRFNVNQAHELGPQTSSSKLDCQLCENNNPKIEASGLWLSTLRLSSTSSTSSSSSDDISIKSSNVVIKAEEEIGNSDYEILWEDLILKDQIGEGPCAKVYHALWQGSDVTVKLYKHQEYYDDVIVRFKQEVSFVQRLRHPNILLFMGAVTSRQHLCIVTEFLPRGSLFKILQRSTTRFDWRRRIHMAMDIARGMNYLHRCNPPILHLDLKASNCLVDKNWNVKVGDFGLSRNKNQTYLNIKADKGTPQWMAPEILSNNQADEKSDVYSYGVILWEIITEQIPWNDLNPMQVIEAVGFRNQRLEIPKDVDPLWASLIESCWQSEPQSRPTFQEILYTLKDLQKKFAIERKR